MKQKKKRMGIGLLGLGTVGSGVYEILHHSQNYIKSPIEFVIEKILVKDFLKKRNVPDLSTLTQDPHEILDNPDITLVVELVGGVSEAKTWVERALKNKKHVVTANKALIAEHGAHLFRLANENNVALLFEAAVAGGIPVIRTLEEGLSSNRVTRILGILNGTCNYILSRMEEEELSFGEILQDAQRHGYAEQDPTLDIDGTDTAQKLAILASLTQGASIDWKKIPREGISEITREDIYFVNQRGYRVRLLGIYSFENGELDIRVHPALIHQSHPLARVTGAFNAVFLHGNAVGSLLLMGQGAGKFPTASAVCSDIVKIGMNSLEQKHIYVSPDWNNEIAPKSLSGLESEYYLRFSVVDRPGTLARITQCLGEQQISVSKIFQDAQDHGEKVNVMAMTYEAREENIQKVLSEIRSLPELVSSTYRMRILK